MVVDYGTCPNRTDEFDLAVLDGVALGTADGVCGALNLCVALGLHQLHLPQPSLQLAALLLRQLRLW